MYTSKVWQTFRYLYKASLTIVIICDIVIIILDFCLSVCCYYYCLCKCYSYLFGFVPLCVWLVWGFSGNAVIFSIHTQSKLWIELEDFIINLCGFTQQKSNTAFNSKKYPSSWKISSACKKCDQGPPCIWQ